MTVATTQRRQPTHNQAGARRHAPPYPAIDPALVYPLRALRGWGFGARSIAALQRAGLPVLKFGKQKFFTGAGLISVLENGSRVSNHKEKPGSVGRDFTGRAKESQ